MNASGTAERINHSGLVDVRETSPCRTTSTSATPLSGLHPSPRSRVCERWERGEWTRRGGEGRGEHDHGLQAERTNLNLPHHNWKRQEREKRGGVETHGSERILKPGPCSIKASLGTIQSGRPPLPPVLLGCRRSRPVAFLRHGVLLPLPSRMSGCVVLLPAAGCSAAPPCQHQSILPPLLRSARIPVAAAELARTSRARCRMSSPVHGQSVSRSPVM